jgi:alpha-glucosidase
VAVNFSDDAQDYELRPPPGATWSVEVASDGSGEGGPYRGSLGPSAAVVLAPHG